MDITINEAIALQNQLRGRLSSMISLRNQIATRHAVRFSDGREEHTTPQYDVKCVETKITQLETWMFKLDAAIKTANARTQLGLSVPVDELLAPLG